MIKLSKLLKLKIYFLRIGVLLFLISLIFPYAIKAASTQDFLYTESTTDFPNPERGMYEDTEYWLGTTNYPSYSGMISRGHTMSHLYLRFDNYVGNATIPVSGLTTVFNNARQAHVKLMIRVTYNWGTFEPDAVETIVNQQIAQLKPILEANKDVIYSWQAGYLGAWGEWHSSNNYTLGSDGNGADITTTKRIYLNILNNLPVGVFAALRYPGFRIPFFGSSYMAPTTAFTDRAIHPEAWTGFHNDCLLAGTSSYPDEGSYNVRNMTFQQVKDYYHNETKYVPLTGETCGVTARSTCAIALDEFSYTRLTSLNSEFDTSVLDILKNQGCFPDISKKLGYRFVLQKVSVPATPSINTPFTFHMDLKNMGYAPAYYDHPVFLIFENITTGTKTPIRLSGADARRWLPISDIPLITYDTSVDISNLIAGNYKLNLWLPDGNPSLQNIPDYAIRFANNNTWNALTGYNYLGDVTIQNGTTNSPSPSPLTKTGDINTDGFVNILDYTLLANAFSTNNTAADLNSDGIVNILDFTILSNNFGR